MQAMCSRWAPQHQHPFVLLEGRELSLFRQRRQQAQQGVASVTPARQNKHADRCCLIKDAGLDVGRRSEVLTVSG